MSYVFMDESGDLGFDFRKKGTSRYFVVAAILVDDDCKKSLDKIVKKIFSGAKHKYRITGILHATEERNITRKNLLNRLKNVPCSIVYAVTDKIRIPKNSKAKEDLYEQMVRAIIQEISKDDPVSKCPTKYILSRRDANKSKNVLLMSHLTASTSDKKHKINIEIKKPAEEKGLQIVDFVSWAIFAKINGDASFAQIIQDKIVCVITCSYKKQNRTNLSDHPVDGPVVRNYLLA